jgi:UDP-N-acetylglucosamine-lysosomal-enzyme
MIEDDLMSYVESKLEELTDSSGKIIWPWDSKTTTSAPVNISELLIPSFSNFSNSNQKPSSHDRRLLDEFADSLRFVSSLYNQYFGRLPRKVIAHMPFLIDKNIMEELQCLWPREFDATSSHRFRHSHDMQYAFAYYYYIIQAHKEFVVEKLFNDELDKNHDGFISTEELSHFTRRLSKETSTALNNELYNCLAKDKDGGDEYVIVSLTVIKECPKVLEILQKYVTSQKKYKWQEGERDQVTFYMVRDNSSAVERRLSEILSEKKKFICLNDNMDNPSAELVSMLHNFYESYFPERSPFELPEGEINPASYIDELPSSSVSGVSVLVLLGVLVLVALGVNRRRPPGPGRHID